MKRPTLTNFASIKHPSAETTNKAPNRARTDTKALTVRLHTHDWKQLKMIALQLERSSQDMILESLQDLFKKYQKDTQSS